MHTSDIRFFAQLNDFLPSDRKDKLFQCHFKGNPSVKHLIESLGVPHTEVGLIRVNDKPVDFTYLLQPGDQIAVYPVFQEHEGLPGTTQSDLSQTDPCFLLDNHLGKFSKSQIRVIG